MTLITNGLLIFFPFFKGSRDNMSLIIVSFPGAPKEDQKEIEKENTCNEKIEKRVKGENICQ